MSRLNDYVKMWVPWPNQLRTTGLGDKIEMIKRCIVKCLYVLRLDVGNRIGGNENNYNLNNSSVYR